MIGLQIKNRERCVSPELTEQFRSLPVFSDTFTQHLLSVALDYQEGIFAGTNSFIEELTGTAPLTVQAFMRKHAAKFA